MEKNQELYDQLTEKITTALWVYYKKRYEGELGLADWRDRCEARLKEENT